MKDKILKLFFLIILEIIITFMPHKIYGIIEDVYTISTDSKYVYDILPGTSVEALKSKLELGNDATFYKDGNSQENDALIGSGMTLTLENSESYVLVVKGDLNGDGKSTSTDILQLKQLIVQLKDSKEYDTYCVDINEDGKLTTSDLLKLKCYQVNILDNIINAKGIILEKQDVVINLKDEDHTTIINAKVIPATANQTITWESSNPSIAEVDTNGNITAKQGGTVQITAKDSANHFATCNIEVKDAFEITKRIYIGDSRTEGMKNSVANNAIDVWSCKVGVGYNWLVSIGVPAIEDEVTSGAAIIILMGINDLYHEESYYKYINDKAIEWEQKGAKTYFVSANPIATEDYNAYTTTPRIKQFNQTMIDNLNSSVTFIDTYNGLSWPSSYFNSDGIHYTNQGYLAIYNFINAFIENN